MESPLDCVRRINNLECSQSELQRLCMVVHEIQKAAYNEGVDRAISRAIALSIRTSSGKTIKANIDLTQLKIFKFK